MKKMPLTHSSTAEQEDKQEERGSCQTLWAISELHRGLNEESIHML